MQDRIRITDQDVQNFLRSPSGQAELATEYRIGHILVALPDEATPKDIAAAEARVKKAQDELAAGKDWAEVAATYSSSETALKGGDLGWRKAAQLPELFVASAESMKPNDIAGPFRTPGGFHLIKLLGKRGVDDVKVPQWQNRQRARARSAQTVHRSRRGGPAALCISPGRRRRGLCGRVLLAEAGGRKKE